MSLEFNHTDDDLVESWFAGLAEGPAQPRPTPLPAAKKNYTQHIENPDEHDILRFRLEAQKKRKAAEQDVANSAHEQTMKRPRNGDEEDEDDNGRAAAQAKRAEKKKVNVMPYNLDSEALGLTKKKGGKKKQKKAEEVSAAPVKTEDKAKNFGDALLLGDL